MNHVRIYSERRIGSISIYRYFSFTAMKLVPKQRYEISASSTGNLSKCYKFYRTFHSNQQFTPKIGSRTLIASLPLLLRSRAFSSSPCRFSSTDVEERWYYAVDVPKSKPSWANWTSTKTAEKYLPFSIQDSKALEAHYQSKDVGVVPVMAESLFEVDIEKRNLQPIYWDGPIYDVRRGTWFIQDGSKLKPCSEKIAEEIELLYNIRLKENKAKLSNIYLLDAQEKGKKIYVSFSDDNTAKALTGDLAPTMLKTGLGERLVRGYIEEKDKDKDKDKNGTKAEKSTQQLEDKQEGHLTLQEAIEKIRTQNAAGSAIKHKTDHLILCVHGIGQKLGERLDSVNFVGDIDVFRDLLRAETDSIQVLPIIWRHDIDFGSSRQQLKKINKEDTELSLEDINVDGITALRQIVGDVVLDVLMYYQPNYHKQILKVVSDRLNKIYHEFCTKNPGFAENPKVSIIGHSLGSALCFDLLMQDNNREAPLNFKVTNLFGVGSPVGMFELLKGHRLADNVGGIKVELMVDNYFNIFHPSDPVSYRVEPLLDKRAAYMKPEQIPYTKGGLTNQFMEFSEFSLKMAQNATTMWNSTFPTLKADIFQTDDGDDGKNQQELSPDVKKDVIQNLKSLNRYGRLDFELQAGVLDINLIAAIASHVSYFENADLAKFLISHLDETTK